MKIAPVLAGISVLAAGFWSCTRTASKTEALVPVVSSAERPENVEAVITHLENKWTMAMLMQDARRLEGLYADDFSGTSPTAHTYTKTDALEELKSGKYSVRSTILDEISVNVYGNLAIAFTSQELKGRNNGLNVSSHYRYTDVWLKRDGKWKLVASQGSRLEEQHPREPKNK